MKTLPGLTLTLAFLFITWPFLAPAADATLKTATYCHALEDNQSPKDPAASYYPDQIVYLSVELKGRPATGIASAKFYFRDDVIAEAKVDVAELNKGILFSIGQSTYVGFTLKPTGPLPLGGLYHTELAFDGQPLGSYPFRVDAPPHSLPSKIHSTVLAKRVGEHNAPVDQTTHFTSVEKVVLAGRGDLGNRTWLEANWYISGKLIPAGTKVITLQEDKKDVPFYFAFIPETGWPAGPHAVALLMNGQEVARQTFTITAAPADAAKKITVSRTLLLHDDGKGGAGEEAKTFTTADLTYHVKFVLAAPALIKGTHIAWTLVKSPAASPQQIAVAQVEDEGLLGLITGDLTTKKGLPPGAYRVDLLQGETVLTSQEFTITEAEK